MQLNFYLDAIPVVLAVLALYKLSFIRRTLIVMLSKTASIILIICQTTWIHAYLNSFSIVTSIMDILWTVFNALVMTIILLLVKQQEGLQNERRRKI